ncbi:phage baseplate assembly protein V [Telmatospirillum sp. J64-1]|uniref:phage baseplate assembly protein V n=1 Tax=Telmatospirillum sp. J64-1 TaxID=2502183 RepID=UPI00115C854F|nr:phage baseplate assembly protein V [Telmatospirillum sp. J64-1]
MSHSLSELYRKLSNLIGLGTIAEVDHSSARVRVEINGRVSGWLPYPADIGNNYIRWRPLRAGTQVLLACPAGDPANAVIVQILYSQPLPPPGDEAGRDLVQFNDGTTLQYDSDARVLTVVSAGKIAIQAADAVDLTAGGAVTISAAAPVSISAPSISMTGTTGGASLTGNFTLTGSLSITGDISTNGNISATGTIMDGGGNSNHHTH